MSIGLSSGFHPLVARTPTVQSPVGPVAYDCVKFIIIRDGTAIVFSEFGQQSVSFGDTVLVGPSVLFGVEPEGRVTVTTGYIDSDMALDQFFWQYSAKSCTSDSTRKNSREMYSGLHPLQQSQVFGALLPRIRRDVVVHEHQRIIDPEAVAELQAVLRYVGQTRHVDNASAVSVLCAHSFVAEQGRSMPRRIASICWRRSGSLRPAIRGKSPSGSASRMASVPDDHPSTSRMLLP